MTRLALVIASSFLPSMVNAQNLAGSESSVPGGSLLLASYIGFFALLLGYLGILSRRQSVIEDDIETLQRRLDTLVEDKE